MMRVTLLSENITTYIPLINKVLPSHSQVPILSNILLQATVDGFYIKSTDLEMGAEIKIPAKIEEQGGITVPGREFLEAINSLPKDKITIEQQKDLLVLKCRGNTVTFNTIPEDEFPQLYKFKGEEVARFEKNEFEDIFSYLSFSVSQEETRPQLTGVYIDKSDDGFNFVATDGYRMSVKTLKDKNKSLKGGLIISVKLVNEVMAFKGDGSIVLYVNNSENQVVFEMGEVILVGRMIEGAFPDYQKVIPKESKTTVVFDREDLQQNVKLASVFAKDNSNIVSVEVLDEELKLSTKTQGVGEGEAVLECQKTGEDNKIAFNIKFLSDLLKSIDEKSVTLKLNSSIEPALFEIKEKNYIHIIMPVQVED